MASELGAWAETGPSTGEQKVSPRPVDLLHLSHYALGEGALEQEVLHEAMSDKD
jgi:hypothetical protein